MASVIYDHVTKRFGDVVAVNDMSLDIPDKEFLVLVGPSGCGKTTALRLLAGLEEITSGIDELGVLLMGHARGAYWYGSRLSITEARRLVPYNNATSLQVTAALLAGMVWAIENPRAGVVEPDEIEHERALAIAGPYLGEVVGVYADWTPLAGRSPLFSETIDASCPWQFVNFRVL